MTGFALAKTGATAGPRPVALVVVGASVRSAGVVGLVPAVGRSLGTRIGLSRRPLAKTGAAAGSRPVALRVVGAPVRSAGVVGLVPAVGRAAPSLHHCRSQTQSQGQT